MTFSLSKLLGNLATTQCAMIDLETLDLEPTSVFYSLGARLFHFGDVMPEPVIDPDHPRFGVELPDFLQYINPADMLNDRRFTTSKETLDWTREKNQIELDRAWAHGEEPELVLRRFKGWCEFNKVKLVLANSPSFDISILRHAYKMYGIDFSFVKFRNEFDVRTVREILYLMGEPRYMPVPKNERLHSALSDCTLQIADMNRFFAHIVDTQAAHLHLPAPEDEKQEDSAVEGKNETGFDPAPKDIDYAQPAARGASRVVIHMDDPTHFEDGEEQKKT